MPELRWLIWLLGLAALAGAVLYWRWRMGQEPSATRRRRREPVLGENPPEEQSGRLPHAADGASDGFEGDPKTVPEVLPPQEMIVTLRLMARDRQGFSAEKLILALRNQGLRHGKYGIFHAFDEGEDITFSVANLVEPGTFDLAQLKTQRYPGISLFLVLPGPADPLEAFDRMISLGKMLALEFSGDLLDEQGGILSVPRERFLREEIISSQRLQF